MIIMNPPFRRQENEKNKREVASPEGEALFNVS
jgi:tRNA1(Val) A37 N6-methylase TrmN6